MQSKTQSFKSEIFKLAWELSRKASKKFGGKAKSYFSESLKMIYQKGYAKVKSLLNPSPKTILTAMIMILIILPVEIQFKILPMLLLLLNQSLILSNKQV